MKTNSKLKGPVLFVDDNNELRESVKKYLELKGDYFVVDYESGLKAIEEIQNGLKYKVAIIDLSLDDIDGSEVIEVSKRVNPDAYVISSSIWFLEEYRSKINSDEHIEKGLNPFFTLKNALDEYFKKKERSKV